MYYELEPGSLTWVSDDGGKHEEINAEASDVFFTMPDENITVSAKYRAMTNGVILSQDKLAFGVEQIRSGSRWNPQIAWKITDPVQLTATVIPDSAANKNVVWNVKDTDGSSTDVISVDDKGTVTVNREAKWIQDLIKAGVTNQELYPSKPIMTEGKNYASVTVTTEAGQKRASCLVTVMPPQKLNAVIAPDQADNKKLVWETNDGSVLTVDQGGSVEVNQDSAWIQVLIATDETRLKDNKYALSTAAGSKKDFVTVTTEDGQHKDTCEADITFTTTDLTVVHPEKVQLDKEELVFEMELVKEGKEAVRP